MVQWILKDFGGRMSLESRFLTNWGARRILRKNGFRPMEINDQIYCAFDSKGWLPVTASIMEGIGDNLYVVSISAHDPSAKLEIEANPAGEVVIRWLMRRSASDLWFEGSPPTLSEAHEVLNLSGFSRVETGIEGSYKRRWASGITAMADLFVATGGYKIAIRYYDKFGSPIRGLVQAIQAANGMV